MEFCFLKLPRDFFPHNALLFLKTGSVLSNILVRKSTSDNSPTFELKIYRHRKIITWQNYLFQTQIKPTLELWRQETQLVEGEMMFLISNPLAISTLRRRNRFKLLNVLDLHPVKARLNPEIYKSNPSLGRNSCSRDIRPFSCCEPFTNRQNNQTSQTIWMEPKSEMTG